jgi:hypothetical protein
MPRSNYGSNMEYNASRKKDLTDAYAKSTGKKKKKKKAYGGSNAGGATIGGGAAAGA